LSLQGTGQKQTEAVQLAIGYAILFGIDSVLVPFFSIDRETVRSPGKPADRQQVLSFGATGAILNPYFPFFSSRAANLVSITAQHVVNTENDTQLSRFRLIETPILGGWLNDYNFPLDTSAIAFQPILNLRTDVGFYTDRGNIDVRAQSQDFFRIGTQFGIAAALASPSIDLTVLNTYLYGVTGFRRDMNLFEALATYNIYERFVGLTASYRNGLSELTAQRTQNWTLSLSLKF